MLPSRAMVLFRPELLPRAKSGSLALQRPGFGLTSMALVASECQESGHPSETMLVSEGHAAARPIQIRNK